MMTDTRNRRDPSFFTGLLAGTFVGAGLAIWLVPRMASELRQRVTDSATDLSNRASERYQQASTRFGEAVGDLATKGQNARDDMADAVVRGANQVARHATALKTDRASDTKKLSTVDRAPSGTRSL